jgi:transglutaminase-like putative cysteine protease
LPRPSPYQQCLEYSLDISPTNCARRDEVDAFGNLVTRVEFEHAHRRLDISTQMEVSVHARPAVSAADTVPWDAVRDSLTYSSGAWPARGVLEASRFRHESPYVRVKQAFTDYADECFPPGQPVLAGAVALMQKLNRELTYAPGETNISTPLTEVLQNRRGVCQDFAHLMIGCLRSIGLAARYVSGYILTAPPPGRSRLIGADASHAWTSIWCGRSGEDGGWVDIDPTNNCLVDDAHVTLGWGRDFGDVTPMRGVILGGGTQQLGVRVTVAPRVEAAAIQSG